MRLVFFDFDRTLTTRDTILSLGLFLASAKSTRLLHAGWFMSALLLLKFRLWSNHRFKEAFCRCLLTGESEERIQNLSREFSEQHIRRMIRAPIVGLLEEHRRAGDEVYVVTSNFDFVLEPLQHYLNADGVIATEPEVVGGRYTGRLACPACWGSEKVTRVLARFGQERVRNAIAYGDSRGDRELLDFVETPVWV